MEGEERREKMESREVSTYLIGDWSSKTSASGRGEELSNEWWCLLDQGRAVTGMIFAPRPFLAFLFFQTK